MTAKKEGGKEVKVKSKPAPKSSSPVEKALIDNFISLQRVMANMASKLDTLNDRVSKLLDVFEISAKALAEKDFNFESDQETVEKLDRLIDQNKVIAKGLTMLYENFDTGNYKKEQSLREAAAPIKVPRPSSPQRGFFNQIIPRRIPSREEQERMRFMAPQIQNMPPVREMPQNAFQQPQQQNQQQMNFEAEPSQEEMEERGTNTQGYRASIMERGEGDTQEGQEQTEGQDNQKNQDGKDELEDIFSGY